MTTGFSSLKSNITGFECIYHSFKYVIEETVGVYIYSGSKIKDKWTSNALYLGQSLTCINYPVLTLKAILNFM